MTHTLGLLWIDALCRWYPRDRGRFIREVIYPLAATAAIGSMVAIYQGFVDLSFLNRGFWTYMLRAAGTHGDPNKLGADRRVLGHRHRGAGTTISFALAAIVSVASIAIGVAASGSPDREPDWPRSAWA